MNCPVSRGTINVEFSAIGQNHNIYISGFLELKNKGSVHPG